MSHTERGIRDQESLIVALGKVFFKHLGVPRGSSNPFQQAAKLTRVKKDVRLRNRN